MTLSPVPQPERPPAPMRSPSKAFVVAVAGGLMAAVAGLLTVLWLLVDGTSPQAPTQLELVRIALTVLLGTGGLFGLWLAWRRQRSTEIALQQKERDQADVARAYALQERTALASEADAAARRITDLYTKAVEQLGSDKAPVRLGGLYALERLAQDHAEQRQTIVNVLCAYLRMPYTVPADPPEPGDTALHKELIAEHREQLQEREVRLAAQRILTHHLRPGKDSDNPVGTFWENIALDLTGATLINLNFTQCTIHAGQFRGATFDGDAWFNNATFTDAARFDRTTFTGDAWFNDATFTDTARFERATFTGVALFARATFTGDAWFGDTTFAADAWFIDVTLPSTRFVNWLTPSPWTDFSNARFHEGVPGEVAPFASEAEPHSDEASAPGSP